MASRKIYVDQDLHGNKLINAKTDAPTDPEHIVNKQYVDDLVGGDAVLEEDITVQVTRFALAPGETLLTGMTVTEAFKALLLETINPTLTTPSFALAYSGVAAAVEVGTIANIILTGTLNRGAITGKLVGGVWQAGTLQDYRAGAAISYTINGTIGVSNTKTLSNFTVLEGANSFSASVIHGVGPQPLNSVNGNFSSPLAEGTLNANTSFQGQRNAFYGTSASVSAPSTTSAQVRNLVGKRLNPANGTVINVTIPIGAKKVELVYPASLRALTSCKYVEGMNAEIKDVFVETQVSVEGANGYAAVANRVYTYTPVEAFTQSVTYSFTI